MSRLVASVLIGMSIPVLGAAAPAVADDPSFGGFNATATSAVVRVQIFEPAVPIPVSPQIDASIAYAQAQSSTGPSSGATASYLWPGDTVGNGFGLLVGNPALDYPVKANAKFPATAGAPAQSTIQLTDGNGMTASADGSTTRSTVTAAEIGSNLLSGLGTGLCVLLKQKCPSSAPLTLPGVLPAVATLDAARSQSTVTTTDGKVTASARTKVSGLDLLGGLVTVDGVDMTSNVVSDGDKAKSDGAAKITGLSVAGQKIDLGDPVDLGGTKTALPHGPINLAAIGLSIDYLKTARTTDGATGALSVEGLTITVDASVLSKALRTDLLTGPLSTFLDQIPTAGALLKGLLKLGTKIVITVGDVRVAASAVPAFSSGPTGPVAPPSTPGTTPGDVIPLPGIGGQPIAGAIAPSPQAPVITEAPPTAVPQSFTLPGLTQLPSILLLCALAMAGLAAWLFRAFGAFFLGADDCSLGASAGVPNLREGI